MIITDQTMPDLTGLELAREIRSISNDVPIILIRGNPSKIMTEQIENIGIQEFCPKPLEIITLVSAVNKAFNRFK